MATDAPNPYSVLASVAAQVCQPVQYPQQKTGHDLSQDTGWNAPDLTVLLGLDEIIDTAEIDSFGRLSKSNHCKAPCFGETDLLVLKAQHCNRTGNTPCRSHGQKETSFHAHSNKWRQESESLTSLAAIFWTPWEAISVTRASCAEDHNVICWRAEDQLEGRRGRGIT